MGPWAPWAHGPILHALITQVINNCFVIYNALLNYKLIIDIQPAAASQSDIAAAVATVASSTRTSKAPPKKK